LTRPTWDAKTKRSETDKVARSKYDADETNDMQIVKRVNEVAEKHDATMAQVALAWLLQKKQVVAPIVGATNPDHLASSVDALNLKLTNDDVNYLEELYTPHKVVGAYTKEESDFTR